MSIEHDQPRIQANAISQSYGGLEVLHKTDIAVQPNKLTVITGPSGSGKTTALNILASIARPTTGEVIYYGENGGETNVTDLMEDEGFFRGFMQRRRLNRFRADHVGYVPQKPNLVSNWSVWDNLYLTAGLAGQDTNDKWVERAVNISEALGLREHLAKKAMILSGGQQQRVALARALVRGPEVILADEPSGSLDMAAKVDMHELLQNRLVRELGSTVVIVSHDAVSRDYANTIIELQDGRVISNTDVNGVH